MKVGKIPQEVFGAIEPQHVSMRVRWFGELRNQYPENKGFMLSWACENEPEKVKEIIRTTSFTPMVGNYRGGTFDHELENFSFCFVEAGIEKYPSLIKELWSKLVNESPEPVIKADITFLIRFIEAHENYGKLVEFILHELFGKARPGLIDPDAVIRHIRLDNELFPKAVYETIDRYEDIKEEMVSLFGGKPEAIDKDAIKRELPMAWKKRWPEDVLNVRYLTKEESRLLINKIDELFFN
jgi:hypothetical protein